jgi:SnoaL-like domain
MPSDKIAMITAREEIRELVLLYSRGINRKDFDLLQSLYTADATDSHGRSYYPTVEAFISRLREVLPTQRCSSLFVCNHLITVDGDMGKGEVYAASYHLLPDGAGGWTEHQMRLRYIDTYRNEGAGWRFASRTLVIDSHGVQPVPTPEGEQAKYEDDPSYGILTSRLFHRGPRA